MSLLFTWWAAAIASAVVAFPLVYQAAKAGFTSVDGELEEAARSQGANDRQVFRYVSLPLTLRSLVAGFVLGFARALGEFGATYMVAGNIPGRTQTVPTVIYSAVEAGRTCAAWAWALSVIGLSFVLLWLAGKQKAD